MNVGETLKIRVPVGVFRSETQMVCMREQNIFLQCKKRVEWHREKQLDLQFQQLTASIQREQELFLMQEACGLGH